MASKDLFDDTPMSFGEHLDELRSRVFLALIGVVLATVLTLFFGESLIELIMQPVNQALLRHHLIETVDDGARTFDFKAYVWDTIFGKSVPDIPPEKMSDRRLNTITIEIPAVEIADQMHEVLPGTYPALTDEARSELGEKHLKLTATSPTFAELQKSARKSVRPVALNVQEPFMTYLKVSMIAGLVLSSPWVFYQLWLFIAVGLYPHERKYIHAYLPMSIGLFLSGVIFCFYAVMPPALNFLLGFNLRMNIAAQIRISEWIDFAVLLPLIFGASFQLPLIMLFLQKISIFQVSDYRERRRLSILVIAFLSMVLTPGGDPMTMILMMLPLLGLYELGILMCIATAPKPALGKPV